MTRSREEEADEYGSHNVHLRPKIAYCKMAIRERSAPDKDITKFPLYLVKARLGFAMAGRLVAEDGSLWSEEIRKLCRRTSPGL